MNDQTTMDGNTTVNVNMNTDGDTVTVSNCANCGMPKEEWRGNAGQGFQMSDKVYCCQGCATGTGCTCD